MCALSYLWLMFNFNCREAGFLEKKNNFNFIGAAKKNDILKLKI